jgi:hypothetical protein
MAFADEGRQAQQALGVMDSPRPAVFFGQTYQFSAIDVHERLLTGTD